MTCVTDWRPSHTFHLMFHCQADSISAAITQPSSSSPVSGEGEEGLRSRRREITAPWSPPAPHPLYLPSLHTPSKKTVVFFFQPSFKNQSASGYHFFTRPSRSDSHRHYHQHQHLLLHLKGLIKKGFYPLKWGDGWCGHLKISSAPTSSTINSPLPSGQRIIHKYQCFRTFGFDDRELVFAARAAFMQKLNDAGLNTSGLVSPGEVVKKKKASSLRGQFPQHTK